jgi:1-acyl-sn-glycerol-3-phosphate acyltransferase
MSESLPTVASPEELERLYQVLAPFRGLFRPTFDGWANIPEERPLLFVGNHTLYGMIDSPHLFMELWRERKIFLRTLGDHAHWSVPGWRDLLMRCGAVDGTPENCAEVFRQGESVLVFPGGAREAFKGRGDPYKLLWGERLGFARMAVQHRVTIVPFAALGADEVFELAWDREELLQGPLGSVLQSLNLREDLLIPVPKVFGQAPRPQRLYFRFCPPIPTRQLGGVLDEDVLRGVRDATAAAIEEGLAGLREVRAADPMADFPRYVGRKLGSGLGRLLDRFGRRE